MTTSSGHASLGPARRRKRRASRDSWVPALAAGRFVAAGPAFGLAPGQWQRVAGNLLLPLLALFPAAGLSIICHFFRRWFRVRILRAGLYALAAYFPIDAGWRLCVFEWYVDFRRRGGG